ncbi:hypothetical protein HF896_13260 [Alicycliphilus denitrificans]|uniref:Uncharacterized protein n=2 Tax=Alicycliphilus denitrificans TaxID=179636 RepID=F4G8W0_ALIDK|nr:hypothetical protein [Alicycliphilus denitrificans]AEB84469.1 hypothetical protein Alide2_2096 [Alicycliphilus denitrificans K601]QKD44536.1 hypothetical protein HF896_13260 [Alicycliphilus denitrificans]
MAASLAIHSRLHVALRIAAAVLGGYAFCWGFVARSLPRVWLVLAGAASLVQMGLA